MRSSNNPISKRFTLSSSRRLAAVCRDTMRHQRPCPGLLRSVCGAAISWFGTLLHHPFSWFLRILLNPLCFFDRIFDFGASYTLDGSRSRFAIYIYVSLYWLHLFTSVPLDANWNVQEEQKKDFANDSFASTARFSSVSASILSSRLTSR